MRQSNVKAQKSETKVDYIRGFHVGLSGLDCAAAGLKTDLLKLLQRYQLTCLPCLGGKFGDFKKKSVHTYCRISQFVGVKPCDLITM